jgi:hypothetical protein
MLGALLPYLGLFSLFRSVSGSARFGLRVAGRFVGELNPGGEAEFGVDLGRMGLHRPWRDEKPCGDVLVGEPFADQPHHVALGGGQRTQPLAGRLRSPRPRCA